MAIVSDAPGDVARWLPRIDRHGKNFANLHFFEFELGANVIIRAVHSAEVYLGVDPNISTIHLVIIRGGVRERQVTVVCRLQV